MEYIQVLFDLEYQFICSRPVVYSTPCFVFVFLDSECKGFPSLDITDYQAHIEGAGSKTSHSIICILFYVALFQCEVFSFTATIAEPNNIPFAKSEMQLI